MSKDKAVRENENEHEHEHSPKDDSVLRGSLARDFLGSERLLRELRDLIDKQREEAQQATVRERRMTKYLSVHEFMLQQQVDFEKKPELTLTKDQLKSVRKLVLQQQSKLNK